MPLAQGLAGHESRAHREKQHAQGAVGYQPAQLALQWALRDPRVTSAVIGASSVEQLDTNLDALDFPPPTEDEIAEIDQHAVDSGVNLWARSTKDSAAEIATEPE